MSSALRVLSKSLFSASAFPVLSTTKQVGPILTAVRNKIRNNWKIPKEEKRVRFHGWKTRISTPGGRAVIMRRMLKGKWVLTH